jgi:drug/metabolite transporter (DMT)-like permease
MTQKNQSYCMLLLVTLLWGITFPVINIAAPFMSAAFFVFIRFSLATVMMLPFVWRRLVNTNKLLIFDALIIGLLNAIIYVTQTVGLNTVAPATAAFITGLGVILVPFLSPLLKVGSPTKIDILATIICLIGLYILTGADLRHISSGEYYIFSGAVAYALMVVYMQKITRRHNDLSLLAFYVIAFSTLFACLFTLPYPVAITLNGPVITALIYCASTTVIVFILITHYQRFISTTHAALIYALEPVFASIASVILVNEIFNTSMLVGGGIMLISLFLLAANKPVEAKRSASI